MIDLVSEGKTLLSVNPEGGGIQWENSRFYYGNPIQNEQEIISEEVLNCKFC